MISILFLIFPIAASFLLLTVFKKAGFSGAILVLSFAPILGALLSRGMIFLVQSDLFTMIPLGIELDIGAVFFLISSFVGQLLGLLPVIVLAFVRWPASSS